MSDRAAVLSRQLAPYFAPREEWLEIGAGQGLAARALQDATGARLTLVDVVDYNQSGLPLRTYDGLHLPFPDRAFDHSLFLFVLHHTPDPLPVLREALRVSRESVLVVENHVTGALRQRLTRAIDSLPHVRYGVPICYRAQTMQTWRWTFEQLPVRAELLARFSMNYGFWQNFVMRLRR
jgi:ubiquinone/menaquinone biosynthesis C-methylase UbiE